MVKTDDYNMEEGSAADFDDIKEKEEDALTADGNWLPRSKSAGLKYVEYESDESGGGGRMLSNSTKMMSSMDGGDADDRRLRRQIANCNERRRMQSINAGFQALRQLLPRKDGDKMSKASILAATAEFIRDLLHERNKLLTENSSAAKRRRLDIGEQNGAPTMDEVNIVECIKTIGEMRELLQKETRTRMNYERELIELRNKLRSFPSPIGSDNFSPNSSTSSSSGGNLLIEFAARQQDAQQHLFRPTPIAPAEMNILSSAIASLAAKNSSPGQQATMLNSTPIGISGQTAFGLPSIGSSNHGSGLFVGVVGGQQTQQNSIQSQPSSAMDNSTGANSSSSISQRNLQALVLAIRHLEGAASPNGNLLVH